MIVWKKPFREMLIGCVNLCMHWVHPRLALLFPRQRNKHHSFRCSTRIKMRGRLAGLAVGVAPIAGNSLLYLRQARKKTPTWCTRPSLSQFYGLKICWSRFPNFIKFANQLTLGLYPADSSTTVELQNLSCDVPELHKIRSSPDLEALKLWKGRSGQKDSARWK